MEIVSQTSKHTILSSKFLNNQARYFPGVNNIISPVHIVYTDIQSISVEDFYCVSNGILLYIKDATVVYDASNFNEPYNLCVYADDNVNNPYILLENFDSSKSYFNEYSAGVNISEDNHGSNSSGCISYDKTSTDIYAGIRIDKASNISNYKSISIGIKIPSGDASNIKAINLILDESVDLSVYRKFDNSNVIDGWKNYYFDLNNPINQNGSPSGNFFSRAFIFVETFDSSTIITNIKLENLVGILYDPNTKDYDDNINIFIADDTNCNHATVIATHDGTWSSSDPVSLNLTSEFEYNHIDSTNIHIPKNIRSVLNLSCASEVNRLLTLNDCSSNIDYLNINKLNLNSSIHNTSGSKFDNLKSLNSIFIYSDSISNVEYNYHKNGVNQYIDSSSTTTNFKIGYYSGDTTSTHILTNPIIEAPGEIETITVGALLSKDQSTQDITYDIVINDTTVMSDLNLYDTYDISSEYSSHGLTGTSLKLDFKIPASVGGDYWTTLNSYQSSKRGNKLITTDSNKILSLTEVNLYSYLYGSDSWLSRSQPLISQNQNSTHPVKMTDGMKTIPTSGNSGEIYNVNNNSWISTSIISSQNGRSVRTCNSEFFIIDASSLVNIVDLSESSTTKSSPGDSWSRGSVFLGDINKIYIHGGDSSSNYPFTDLLKAYNISNDSWSSVSSSSSKHGIQGYSKINTKLMHSIGGMSDSSTYINTNDAYNESSDSWAVLTQAVTSRAYQSCGVTRDEKILNALGEDSSGSESSSVYIYTPINVVKFFGFSLAISFSKLFGEAYHVGYWREDSYPNFFTASDSERENGGFYTDDNGRIAFGRGTYWGYYMIWAEDGHHDYTSSTFDEKWKAGYWSDVNGKIGTDDGPLWE